MRNILKIGRTKAYQLAKDGKIGCCRNNESKEYRFSEKHIQDYMLSVGWVDNSDATVGSSSLQEPPDVIDYNCSDSGTLINEYGDNCDISSLSERTGEVEMSKAKEKICGSGNPYWRKGKKGITWTYYYYVTDINGKRARKYKGGFKTKKEAQASLGSTRDSIATDKYANPNKILLDSVVNKALPK
jgi:hypothetical protein